MQHTAEMATLGFYRYLESGTQVSRNELRLLATLVTDEVDLKSGPDKGRCHGEFVPHPLELVANSSNA
jgi:hypothetical protein